MTTADTPLEALVRRDRLVVAAALTLVVLVSWAYLLAGAGTGMSAIDMTWMSRSGTADVMTMAIPVWTFDYAVVMFLMWWVMMVAMMLPSASPMILLFATVNRRQRGAGLPHVPTGLFVLGYLAAWAGFSLVAATLQWALQQGALLTPALVGAGALFGGSLLIAAGLYQLTPLKHACLRHCRSGHVVLSAHWRAGRLGALRMGAEHGAFCVGCCWFLMALLFVGGVMNLYWIAGLALFVLFEKTVPHGHWLGYASGIGLVLWGAGVLAGVF